MVPASMPEINVFPGGCSLLLLLSVLSDVQGAQQVAEIKHEDNTE